MYLKKRDKTTLNDFYLKSYHKLKCELMDYEPDFEVDDIIHDVMVEYILESCKYGMYDKVDYDKIVSKCKLIIEVKKKDDTIFDCATFVCIDPAQLIVEHETIEKIFECVHNIKRTYKTVLEMYLIENMSVKRISEILGLKRDTVTKKIRRGKQKLYEELISLRII